MKTILFYLCFIFLSFINNSAFAQDEFYDNQKTTETSNVNMDSVDVSSYSTAQDYYSNEIETENNSTERTAIIEDSHEHKRRNSARGEFISSVVADVFINVAIIFLTFWQ